MKSLMKKTLAVLPIIMLLALTMIPLGTVMAKSDKPAKHGFTDIVGDNMDGDVTGEVRYTKESKQLKTKWVVKGLEPKTEYQLKLHSKGGADILVCDNPNSGAIWQCGNWGSETFLVLDTVKSNSKGEIHASVKEKRLPVGDYIQMQFIVTQNSAPWSSAWTWENPAETISAFTITDK